MDEKDFIRYLTLVSEATLPSDELLKEKLKVKPLKNKDVPRASKTILDASKEDPLSEYIRDTPDAKHPKWYNRIELLQLRVFVSQWANHKWGFTIGHGRAVICVLPAPEDIKKSRLDKYYFLAARALNFVGKTKQQRKRLEIAGKALFKLIKETLGDDIKTSRSIPGLAETPELEGDGRAALVTVAKEKADAEGRSTWTLSSIPQSTEFWESEGFVSVAEVSIGEDDPTWDRPPVTVLLLLRAFEK